MASNTASPGAPAWAHFRAGDRPGACYSSGHVVVDEELRGGRLVPRYWSCSGQVWPEMHLDRPAVPVDLPADTFVLAVDGQDLAGGWIWTGATLVEDTSGYRAGANPPVVARIGLRHPLGVEVGVHTRLDGGPFLVRWLEIRNTTPKHLALTAVCPAAGVLWSHRYDEHLAPDKTTPFELAWNHKFAWGQEGDFWFEPLPDGTRVVDGGKLGRSGWGRPAFWARDLANGQTVVCELAWGGNYVFELSSRLVENVSTNNKFPTTKIGTLCFRMGLSGHDRVLRVLDPGETIRTPPVHLGYFQADTDTIVQATHHHVRTVVMPAAPDGHVAEIEANHRGYLCDRENEPDLKRDVEVAAAIGAEMYVIDAGWYGNDPNVWWRNTGDWKAGSWLPNGLEPVVAHAKKLGMRFGLWVEIEAAGELSTLKKEHPEWLLARDGKPVNGRALDLTNPVVVTWAEGEIDRIIRRYDLDMYRIDHNHTITPSGNRVYGGYTEDLMWRYYEGLFGIFDRARAKHPKVVFQNCAGGGGRLDWGTLARFHNTELSDWMRQPRGLRILNNITMSLPPEVLLRTFGTEVFEHDLDADLDAQLRMVCLCRPIFRGIAPSLDELTSHLKARILHHLDLYRSRIRPVMKSGRVYHHTPFLPIHDDAPWCVLEYATLDSSEGVVGLFRSSTSGDPSFRLRPRGIDRGRTYEVTLDSAGTTARVTGWELADRGIPIVLENTTSSELVLYRAVDR